MSTRLAKQIIYATFYIIFWIVVIGGAYVLIFHPGAASCFDGKQDGAETGIDCGGSCSKICAPAIQPVSVIAVNAFAAAGNNTFLAKIANPNSDFVAQSFNYSFNVYDASGTLLQSFPGQSFLYASEAKYLVLVNQSVPAGVASVDLTVTNANWIASSSVGPAPQVMVQNVLTSIGSSTPAIALASGQLVNNDTVTIGQVLIVAVFKDSNGSPIGASQTEVGSIAPGAVQNFSVSYPAIAGINLAETEVEAYAVR
jgi:hypothetical protein